MRNTEAGPASGNGSGSPVYEALAQSGILRLGLETTPDDTRTLLLALREQLTGADAVTAALAREHVLRLLRDALGYVDARGLLDATLGRPTQARLPRAAVATLPTRTAAELIADDSLAGAAGWVVQGLTVRGGLTMIYGPPKVGKGTLLTYIVKQIAVGASSCLGCAVTGGPVLWVDLEQGHRLNRRKFMEAQAADTRYPIHIYSGPPPTLEAVEQKGRETGAVIIVVDSLSRFLQLEDENDNSEVTAAMAPLAELAHRLDVGLVPIHHDRKSGGEHGSGMRGASAFLAVADVAVHVKREPGEDETLRRLVCVGRYDEANRTILVRRTTSCNPETPPTEDVADSILELVGTPYEMRRQRILELASEQEMEADAIATALGVTRPAVMSEVRWLLERGKLSRSGTGKKGNPHRYSAVKPDSESQNHSRGLTALQHQNDPGEEAPIALREGA